MPQIQIVRLLDDVEYAEGHEVEATETRELTVGGVRYRTVLCEANAKDFDADMERWTEHAEKITGSHSSGKSKAVGATKSKPKGDDRSVQVREWARTQGMQVSDRGRLPAEIVAAYDAAHTE
jgi:hypothetical protein